MQTMKIPKKVVCPIDETYNEIRKLQRAGYRIESKQILGMKVEIKSFKVIGRVLKDEVRKHGKLISDIL